MNEQQIRNYFGAHIIYRFDGKPEELLDILNGNSVNYIATSYVIYFITDAISINNDRITVFADNTQGEV